MLAYRFVLNLLHAQRFTHSAPCVIDDASGANFNIQWYHSPARRFDKLLGLGLGLGLGGDYFLRLHTPFSIVGLARFRVKVRVRVRVRASLEDHVQ